jgi:hypothetical protein
LKPVPGRRSAPILRASIALLATAAALLAVLSAAPALADSTSEYGEVIRFGGFDSSAFNSEHYGGPLTPGKFLDPTGFAVDPEDNTVYVVDRTSKYAHNPTSWRIQQFSPEGVVLGTTTFTLPNSNFGASAITGLAVDHRAGRLYALVVGSPPASAPIQTWPVAQELLAWSTTANGAHELVAAPGLINDPLHTSGGLVSNAVQLRSGPTLLYSPQGIAIDPLEHPGVDNPVAIEASDLLPEAGLGAPIPGDAIVQQVATSVGNTGQLANRWSGASLKQDLGGSWGPLGISTSPDGTLTVVLDASNLSATDAYVVKLSADLGESTILNNDSVEPPIYAPDQEALWIDSSPFATFAGVGVSDTHGTSSEVIRLSTSTSSNVGGLFAADLFSTRTLDQQFSPSEPGSEYWLLIVNPGSFESNIGIRLLRPGNGEVISDPYGSTITNTLGNEKRGGPCNIGAPEAGLAAGANGTLWVLDRGPRADQPGGEGLGRQIIELAPGMGRFCPRPSGTFTMTPDGGSSHAGEETLTIPAGTRVTFDAQSIKREGGKPFAYEWDLDGNPANGLNHDGFETVRQMQPPEYYWPPSSVTHIYARPGKYTVRAKLHSDYGVYTTLPGTIIVTSPAHPEAQFTATPVPASQQVTFNAAGSTAGVGSIANYHWSWGDGSSEDEGPDTPIVKHAYAQPGDYTVTLTVTNSSFQSATSAPQTVTVKAPPPPVSDAATVLTGPLYGIPPVSYPIPAPSPDRTPTRLSAHARFAAGAFSITLACPPAKPRCAGTVRIETAQPFAVAARAPRRGRPRRVMRRLLLGETRFSLAGGQRKTVSVRLSVKGTALLKKLKHLNALVTISAHDPSGNPGTTTLRVALRAPAAARSRSHRRGA